MALRNLQVLFPYKERYLYRMTKRFKAGEAAAIITKEVNFRKKKSQSNKLKNTSISLANMNLKSKEICNPTSNEFGATMHNVNTAVLENKELSNAEIEACNIEEWTKLSNRTREKLEDKKSMKILYHLNRVERNKSFADVLAAYISVCMTVGLEEEAHKTFYSYFKVKYKAPPDPELSTKFSIKVFNELLKGTARTADYDAVMQVKSSLLQLEVAPDVNTIAYILTCLGRCLEVTPDSERLDHDIRQTLQWMQEQNISLEDLFNSAVFPYEFLPFCLQAIESVVPNAGEELLRCKRKQQQMFSYDQNNPLVNTLNHEIFTNKVNSPSEGVLTTEELVRNSVEQIEREMKGFVEIPNILKQQAESEGQSEISEGVFEKWQRDCRKALLKTVKSRKDFMLEQFSNREHKSLDSFPFFYSLDDQEIVDLLLTEIDNLCMMNDVYFTVNGMSRVLGEKFYQRFVIKYRRKTKETESFKKIYERYCNWYLRTTDAESSYLHRVQWSKLVLEREAPNTIRDAPAPWPLKTQTEVGRLLFGILSTAVITWQPKNGKLQTVPAFQKVYRFGVNKVYENMVASPILLEVFHDDALRALTFPTNSLPMVSVPLPWNSLASGGYVLCNVDFVRYSDFSQYIQRRLESQKAQCLFPVMDSLNQLASIPWKINKDMLDLIIKIFRDGGWAKMDISEHPSKLPRPTRTIQQSMPLKEKMEIQKELLAYHKEKREIYSGWCNSLYKLSITNYFRDSIFWLPQTLDFRGRVYPVPPHLTHLSSDVYRSVLLFAQGKKLGKDGLYWLKLHLVNLTGVKKRFSIQDRLDYCEEMMDEIFDSADNPLDGNQWWTKSDEPWQTLSACKELVNALRSEDPESYVSHLPIHQDGSCNGLQHYAALSRDRAGAESVNLCPSSVPQDVYSNVAARVEKSRQKDAEAGLQIAKSLEGVVKRKIVKQTVMTTVYGVTNHGAKMQILKQLNYLDDLKNIDRSAAATYLARNTFQSLGTIFTSTQVIQDWLGKIAKGVSFYCMQNVEWVTPLGFPVVQPYSKTKLRASTEAKQCDYFVFPDSKKQKNGFPPNFIHSLDSSHMMLTSLFCQQKGISFVSIHDCFWTHASTVPIMNKICREQFVALHSQPILENLAETMIERYSDHVKFDYVSLADKNNGMISLKELLSTIPEKGTFDTRELLDSVFFFS